MVAPLAKYHVQAGNFYVGKKQSLTVQAFLGTCVGVALHCAETGVGGIIHLLLPAPLSPTACTQPEKYATTGLPIFLNALLETGARRESLSAAIAGGALVGPLRQQDLDLDIGGRTVEAVAKFLAAEKIEIIQSETGGFFTCCLNLDLRSGQIAIEPVGRSKTTTPPNAHALTSEEIQAAMKRLKPIPQVALKILRLVDDNEYDIEAIANEIRRDQVITARMLHMANSAMFGVKRTINSLDHAVVFLGRDLLVKIVLTAAIQGYYEQSAMGYALCKGGIYYHAVGCAQTAEALASKTRREEPAKAYTAGLLHDIGKVVLDQFIADSDPLFYRSLIAENQDILAVEKRLLGIDHTQAGTVLARLWSFPEPLTEVIRQHHQPDIQSEHSALCAIVYLADLLTSRFHPGLQIERVTTRALSDSLAVLGLHNDDFAGLVDIMPATAYPTVA